MDKTNFSTVLKQAESVLTCAIFEELTSNMTIGCLSDFLREYSCLLSACESITEVSKALARKAVCYFSLATLESALRTSDGTRLMLSDLLVKIKEENDTSTI